MKIDIRKAAARLGLVVVEQGMRRPMSEVAFLPAGSKGRLQDTPEARRWRRAQWPSIRRQLARIEVARMLGVQVTVPALYLKKITREGNEQLFGLAGHRVVTTAGVNFLVAAWMNTVEPEIMKYHALGTGAGAETIGQTALVTELTTAYNPDNTRATGSLIQGGTANVLRSVGTNTVDAAAAITEHGLMSQAATGGGTLWDRSLFSVINLASGDGLESTYDATFTAGG